METITQQKREKDLKELASRHIHSFDYIRFTYMNTLKKMYHSNKKRDQVEMHTEAIEITERLLSLD